MSGGVPAGWVLVPVEPTGEMLAAGRVAFGRALGGSDAVYRAMLAATPTPPIEGRDADVERARRMAYAPLRSAQHALDVIARGTPHISAVQELAREESERIGAALQALGERG